MNDTLQPQMGNPAEKPKIARMSVVRLGPLVSFLEMWNQELMVLQISTMTALKLPYVEKPCGYSFFAHEIVPIPKSWAATSCNLVSYNQHEHGGHFAVRQI